MTSRTGVPTATGQNAPYDVAIVTAAVLPWLTGPAYLALWHACGLAESGLRVACVIPRLSAPSQQRLWQTAQFPTPEAHYQWLRAEAGRLGCPRALPDFFSYRGYYSSPLRSIIPLEDIFSATPPARVIVLDEPEHLSWYPWTRPRRLVKAEKVVGLVLTNYKYYVEAAMPPGLRWISSLVAAWHRRLIRSHTDLAVMISPTPAMDGLRHPYCEARITGVLAAYAEVAPVQADTAGIYFLGRLVWDKGLATVIEISRRTGLRIDIYGDGPDAEAIERMAKDKGADLRFFGPNAAPWNVLKDYRVFLNPSLSEVLCTATAEALVAGRHVVLPVCPGNTPFLRYPNVYTYHHHIDDAVEALKRALHALPQPPDAVRRDFDWRAACRNLAALWKA